MYERSPKNSALDTILYEDEMLRYCAQALLRAKRPTGSEGNLYIEGFLLHFRNLLEFLTNRNPQRPDDITIERLATEQAYTLNLPALIVRADEINRVHGGKLGKVEIKCHEKISKFLQHCTSFRHANAMSWNIREMFADMDPVLDELKRGFTCGH